MKKKNCIITGGTSGLGLSLVEKFINNGFFVHILAKDNKKINNLNNYLHKKNLKSFKFYQTDLAEINELNKSISQLKNLNTIDILINNAGAIFLKKALNSKLPHDIIIKKSIDAFSPEIIDASAKKGKHIRSYDDGGEIVIGKNVDKDLL